MVAPLAQCDPRGGPCPLNNELGGDIFEVRYVEAPDVGADAASRAALPSAGADDVEPPPAAAKMADLGVRDDLAAKDDPPARTVIPAEGGDVEAGTLGECRGFGCVHR
jgi:hypothetical protein